LKRKILWKAIATTLLNTVLKFSMKILSNIDITTSRKKQAWFCRKCALCSLEMEIYLNKPLWIYFVYVMFFGDDDLNQHVSWSQFWDCWITLAVLYISNENRLIASPVRNILFMQLLCEIKDEENLGWLMNWLRDLCGVELVGIEGLVRW